MSDIYFECPFCMKKLPKSAADCEFILPCGCQYSWLSLEKHGLKIWPVTVHNVGRHGEIQYFVALDAKSEIYGTRHPLKEGAEQAWRKIRIKELQVKQLRGKKPADGLGLYVNHGREGKDPPHVGEISHNYPGLRLYVAQSPREKDCLRGWGRGHDLYVWEGNTDIVMWATMDGTVTRWVAVHKDHPQLWHSICSPRGTGGAWRYGTTPKAAALAFIKAGMPVVEGVCSHAVYDEDGWAV